MNTPFIEHADFVALVEREPLLRIVDARSMPHGAPVASLTGAEQFAAGHIPGAIHLDYAHELADPATPYATRVAPPDVLAAVLGAHGIGDESVIVVYDDGDVPYAARFVWTMRYLGRDDVRILAGGFKEWRALHGAQSVETQRFAPTTFTPHARESIRATRDEVLAIANGATRDQLLETQRDKTYAMRDRDIAGAIRLSGNQLMEDARGGRVAAPETLAALIGERNLDRDKRTIVTCGSGVSASGAYIALLEAGFTNLAVYDGSWMEWSHDDLPTVPKPLP